MNELLLPNTISNAIDKYIIITFSIVNNPYPYHSFMFITETIFQSSRLCPFELLPWNPLLKTVFPRNLWICHCSLYSYDAFIFWLTYCVIRFTSKLNKQISSVMRQIGKSQNGCFKKTKHAKFSKKQTFLTPWIAHDSPICLITDDLHLKRPWGSDVISLRKMMTTGNIINFIKW